MTPGKPSTSLRSLTLFVRALTLTSLALPAPAAQPPFVYKDPNAQPPEWTHPLNAPFVDIFHLLPNNHLLVGPLTWDPTNSQLKQADLKLLSITDGSTLWTTKRDAIPGATYSLIAMQQATIILQAATPKETKLLAYDVANGQPRWNVSIKGPALSTPIADTPTMIVATTDHVLALDVTTGRQSWTRPVDLRSPSDLPTIVTTADSVCIAAKTVACVDRATGTQSWSKPDPDTSPMGRAFLAGTKLITATDTTVTAWNPTNGTQLWHVQPPVQGLVDIVSDDNTIYSEWLDSTAQAVRIQSISLADGKPKWTSDPTPIPRSTLAIGGHDTAYFSSTSMLVALNLRTGKVTARALLPIRLVDTDRKPDDILVRTDSVTVYNERGAATFNPVDLKLLQTADMQVGGTSSDAQRVLKEEVAALAKDTPSAAPSAISLHLGQSSALSTAAQTRIQLAYAHARPVLESPNTSHAEKAAAHGYVAQQINGAISMQRQAIQLEQMEAAADLANSALGLLQAIQTAKRREAEARITLFRYYSLAGELRNEGTPPGYAMAGGANRVEVFDSAKNAIADVYHSNESAFGWVHISLLTEDGSHLIGAHVAHSPSPHTTSITSDITRPDLSIESYPLAKATWKPATPLAVEDALIAGIESGKTTSLATQYGTCYMATLKPLSWRAKELVLAAIAGRNTGLLKEMRVNGAFNLAHPMFDFESIAVARDTLDPSVVAIFEDAATHEKADFELAKAARLDDRSAAKAALDAHGNPDGFAPLNDTQTCNTPPLLLAKSDAMRTLLLESGAHINILGDNERTPLDAALARKDKSLERFLRSHGGKTAADLPK